MKSLVCNNESVRVEALHKYQILDTLPEQAFDDLVYLASQICGTPIALINLIDSNRQWFKAKVGLDLQEIPRNVGFCSFCMELGDVFVIPDTLESKEFAQNPVVTSKPHLRFYAGVPLIAPEGEVIGVLCIADIIPRYITSEQVEALRALSRLIVRQLDIRRSVAELTNIKADYQEAQEALRQSQCILRSFYDSAPMIMGCVEIRNNDIVHISDNAPIANFFGLNSQGIESCIATDRFERQKYVRSWIPYYVEAKRRKSPVSFEYLQNTPQGERWLRATVSAIPECCGTPPRFAYVIEDIADRKQAEQQLREQAALLNISTDAIILRDLSNNILLWNNSAEKIYGWQAEEAIGKNANELLFRELPQQYEKIYQTVLEHHSWQGELHKTTKSGKDIIVESRWTLVQDEHQQAKSILVVDTDITQKKQLETQFLRAQRMESIGTLASGIAHDLNNVLSPILMSVQLLKAKGLSERDTRMLDIVENNAKRGGNLVKQVLSFARGIEGDRTVFQLKHLIVEMKQIVEQTFPKSIELYTEVQPDLMTVCGDSTQLHQVLMNLCLNARDAMPNGGSLKIRAENILIDENYSSMHLDAQVGSYIVITVSDTGFGMKKELLDRIFEPFFTTKEFGKGTGLGLSTVMGIIKGHGGFITVSSENCKGTQFKVYLPGINIAIAQQVEEIEMPIGEGQYILVVDDEAAIREVTVASLENHNYQAIAASDGIEAIALYAQNKDKIKGAIVDMMMPNMDGATTISTLHKMNPLLRIVAVSGLATREQVPIDKASKLAAFLPKPYTAQELLKKLHQVFN